jgi:uncharacterized membrane protein YphA (DoxX/SURF4 family)
MPLVAAIVLALVFTASGLGKLRDLPGSREAMLAFGFPTRIAPAMAWLLPVGELVIAILLILPQTRWEGGVATILLLVAFIVGIAGTMLQGRAPECHCFGQLHTEPVGWKTIARNIGLMLVALPIVADTASFTLTPSTTTDGRAILIGGITILGSLTVLLVFAMLTMREDGRLEMRLTAIVDRIGFADSGFPGLGAGTLHTNVPKTLPIGALAPAFALPNLDGNLVSLDDLLTRGSGRTIALLFTDPACGPCGSLLREIPSWETARATTLEIVVISRGDRDANLAKAHQLGLRAHRVLRQHAQELSNAFGIPGTPSALLIAADGTVASPVAGGIDAVRRLLATAGNEG